jgi:coenzyme F420-reducing hydrogenase beta subunit
LQEPQNSNPRQAYIARAIDEHRYKNSTSAGVCSSLADYMLDKGYTGCGARYNSDSNTVEHFIARSYDDFLEAQGSKYLQSNGEAAFREILKPTNKEDNFIVFGTPCQIAGIRNYIKLKKMEEQYVLVDFFCHGVPSYLLWENYLDYHQIRKPNQVVFRKKTERRWNDYCLSIHENDKKLEHFSSENDLFHRLFLFDVCLCETCTKNCQYYHCNSNADIRVGDCWSKDLHRDKDAMSTILIYQSKMNSLIHKIPNLSLTEVDHKEKAFGGQPLEKRKENIYRSKVIKALKKKANLKFVFYRYVGPKLVLNKINKIVHG